MTNGVFDVAIIGYGPAGVTIANLLGQYGLPVVVFERDAEIYPLPRAIHFDGEVMRVFETLGLRREVEAIASWVEGYVFQQRSWRNHFDSCRNL
jgi:3-(3-hydroxy-phenyl)propionate hydroxylase